MKHLLTALFIGTVAITSAIAATDHGDKERKEDIARHRAMASAHENAAKCLEAKKDEATCNKELQAACKGLAIGKYYGMKHEH